MKFLLIAFMILVRPYDFIELHDVLENCDVEVNNILSITLSTSESTLLLINEEEITDVLDTPVIRTLEQNEDDSFDIPDETYLIVVGVIEISELSIDLYPSFGIIYNAQEDKHWILIFKNNVTIRDVEGDICGMFEILIY